MRAPAVQVEAVVFDLFYTLVHPGSYPAGHDREGWLAAILGVDAERLRARWDSFEPVLEAGRVPAGPDGLGPELTWIRSVATDLGVTICADDMSRIDADWDLTRRTALLDPPSSTVTTVVDLRERGMRTAILSDTHALEMRSWERSPLSRLVDVVGFSYRIGVCKPDPQIYLDVLSRLSVPAAAAVYVGDGSNDELAGARAVGFGLIVLADHAARQHAPLALPRLEAQADVSISSLEQLSILLEP